MRVRDRVQPLQIEPREHRLAVVHIAGQATLAEGSREIAGVAASTISPPSSAAAATDVPACAHARQAHHRAVAEHVVLTIEQAQVISEVEIASVVAVPRGGVAV
jgi:hypothetical protein